MEILYILPLLFCLAGRMINCLPHAEISHTILTKAYIERNTAARDKRSPHGTNFGPHSTYPASNGLTCYVCRPGFYKRSDCTVDKTTASCEQCSKGEYNGNYNIAMRCEACRTYCVDQNAIVENQCNSTADITCRCKDGFYNHSKGSGEWICVPFSDCPPGEELYLQGTAISDTQCLPCRSGTYSTTTSLEDKCLSCSRCTSDQTTLQSCDGTRDTVCGTIEQSQSWKIYVPIIIVAFIIGLIVLVFVLLHRYGYLTKLKAMCCRFNDEGQTEMNDLAISQSRNNNNNQQIDEVRSNLPSSRDAYISDQACSSTETDKMWSPVFRRISTGINLVEWKSVMRTLFSKYDKIQVAERNIEEICHDYPNNVKEQIYQCLLKWFKRAGDNAFLDDISSALEKDNMLSLADELENEYPMLLLKKCNETKCLQVRKLSNSC
ncbi:tumor necrosis factor receptor superfamily member 6-like [Mytilus californianus]|uniref:tumor necrosis factor receptor superfamily member 6-like n=1 Tax=Mytilus californianus TaxID=6549 RepID=UPI0022464CD8|nr:tumor necrosis factor receptor superfamily member 6-like [Mytilus californianus]XP_052102832.1 tumor necrosis factor receptor superfamily member 6-like [Mytilus californianus]XP_052102834.1 tumor necrosis factor receptor superfamily member 6-like [Mytilus californianus]